MRRFAILFGLLAVPSLMLGTGQAQAQIQLNLVSSLSPAPGISAVGPYVTVTLTRDGTGVDVSVAALNASSLGTTNHATVYALFFNLPGRKATVTNFSGPGTLTSNGSGVLSGFGTFSQYVTWSSPSIPATTVSFTVNNETVGAFGVNAGGYQFGTHWYSNYGTGERPQNGYVANVPEPGPLLGAGVVTLLGLGYTWRRRRATA